VERPGKGSVVVPGVEETAVGDDAMTIDCRDCVMQNSAHCDDCLVTFICSREPDEALVVPVAEVRALRLLADSGLVPTLKHERRVG
jgi:hypothetical protein